MSRVVTSHLVGSSVLAVAFALLAGACKAEYRVFEGIGCTTDEGADPKYLCARQEDLVCIATYSVPLTKPKDAMKFDGGARDVYICRRPCAPDAGAAACASDEVCCVGRISGRDYGKMGGCTPPVFCSTRPVVVMDGPMRMTVDARAPEADTARDAAADVPVDSAVDAVAPDAAVEVAPDAAVEVAPDAVTGDGPVD